MLNVPSDVIAQNYKTEVTAAAPSSSSRAELVVVQQAKVAAQHQAVRQQHRAAARSTASACSSNITCSIGAGRVVVEADHRRESLNSEDDDEDVF